MHHPLAMMRPETNDSTLAAYSLPQDKAREGACREATCSRTASFERIYSALLAGGGVGGRNPHDCYHDEGTVPASLELAFESLLCVLEQSMNLLFVMVTCTSMTGPPRVQWVAVFSLCEYALYLRALKEGALQEQIASHVQVRLVKALGLVLMQ